MILYIYEFAIISTLGEWVGDRSLKASDLSSNQGCFIDLGRESLFDSYDTDGKSKGGDISKFCVYLSVCLYSLISVMAVPILIGFYWQVADVIESNLGVVGVTFIKIKFRNSRERSRGHQLVSHKPTTDRV